jgi:hypothetical protein
LLFLENHNYMPLCPKITKKKWKKIIWRVWGTQFGA